MGRRSRWISGLTIGLLVALIAGQGAHLYRLEKEHAKLLATSERSLQLVTALTKLLHNEVRPGHPLALWEHTLLQRRNVPDSLLPEYESWNTVRFGSAVRTMRVLEDIGESEPSASVLGEARHQLEPIVADLLYQYQGRMDPEVLAKWRQETAKAEP